MGMVSSSFLSAPEQTINESNYIYHQQFSTLHNTSNNDKMPVIVDVMSIGSSEPKKRTKVLRTSVVNYGPISVRKRHSVAPTLATGRRSKDAIVEGEAAIKRDTRRMKNREAAKTLRQLRNDIEAQLKDRIKELESEECSLLFEIDSLREYKHSLEERCRQLVPMYNSMNLTAAPASLRHHEYDIQPKLEPWIPFHYYCADPSDQRRPPSPQ
ncbi:unnamed protein product [Rotaria socialis]|uniref:BZIP domain-containing protein n=1 Tax=Rotaria socialis TaxID=392032 RepID=A0A818CFU6_9BILA|nr:unnamed protein product [Rotaria socialis]CAF3402912.1 unnamed protein product [Rotaria socialis]CAF3426824.1 unnamed protein product [Rotaria socialis]CAF3521932.1 unnamed protein product [Rotaria socialis]CAF4258322.1 unnamed protein product [Rotaria socialis]